jgi:hypothetical protein
VRALAIVVLALAITPAAKARQQNVFRGETRGVFVDVSVRDGRQVVTGLSASDFEVLDNGVAQKIEDASIESMPVDATIMLDVSDSARLKFGGSLATAADRVRALLKPDDHAEVLLVGGRIVDAQSWDYQPLGLWSSGTWLGDRGTSLFDGLVASLIRPTLPGFRRVVVALTDGIDTSSFVLPSTRTAIVDRADAVVQIVGIGFVTSGFQFGRDGSLSATGRSALNQNVTAILGTDYGHVLSDIASRTGGHFFNLQDSTRFVDAIGVSIQDFRQRYLLRYVPAGVDPAGWHTLTIRVKGKKYQIDARRGYAGLFE